MKLDDNNNENMAIPELFKMIDIHGYKFNLDTIITLKAIVSTILDQGVDHYFLVNKTKGLNMVKLDKLMVLMTLINLKSRLMIL